MKQVVHYAKFEPEGCAPSQEVQSADAEALQKVVWPQKAVAFKLFTRVADHYANFTAAGLSRNCGTLTDEILEGLLSSALCHTGNISYRLGEKLSPGAIRERVQDTPAMGESIERMTAHLTANGVDLTRDQITLRACLEMDPSTERFVKNSDANNQLAGAYRKGFEVPSRV